MHARRAVTLSFHDQTVEVRFPESIAPDIGRLFSACITTSAATQSCVTIEEHKDRYSVYLGDEPLALRLSRANALLCLMDEVTRAIITRIDTAVALHAAAVARNGTAILMPGTTGSGKSSSTAWLVDSGFDYLTDEIAIITRAGTIIGFRRPLVIKPGAAERVRDFSVFEKSKFECGSHLLALPPTAKSDNSAPAVGLMVFPKYEPGGDVKIEVLSVGQASLMLFGCNLNARNFKNGGLDVITSLSRQVPAVVFRFGGFDQLEGTLDVLIRLVTEGHFAVRELRNHLASLEQRTTSNRQGGTCSVWRHHSAYEAPRRTTPQPKGHLRLRENR
jgi:hypothetical protein